MPRMSKKRRLEWSFFLRQMKVGNTTGDRITYNDLCRGCTHSCKYCYASFMKRFTGHTEPWGTFLDVKHWPAIKNPQKYKGQRVVIGSVTDGTYYTYCRQYGPTHDALLSMCSAGIKSDH